MDRDLSKTSEQYAGAYRATHDAIRSVSRTVLSGVLLFCIGVFGLGMVWLTATAVAAGTPTRTTFFAGVFGVATTAFAGYELYHL